MANRQTSLRSKQGGLVLWDGMNIRQMARFFSARPLLHWRKSLPIATLPGFALYNSVMGALESLIYSRQIEKWTIERPPLFVIGHWRSGTTLLHNLLAQDPQHNYPKMYQVVFPNHFLLTEKVMARLTAWMVPKSRPMDNVPAGWHVPQEEDIAMVILTCLSPYMMLANPDRMDKVRHMWDLKGLSAEQLDFWKQQYLRLLKKVSRGDSRRLVLKSPVNTLRIPILRELFPGAQFIYIYRNPFDVLRSAVHLRQTMFRENCLGKPRIDRAQLEESIAWVHRLAFDTYHKDKQSLAPHELCEVRFEDLEQDPLGQLETIYRTLELDGFDQLRKIIEPQVPSLKRYKKNKYPATRKQMDEVYERFRYAFDYYGYPHPAETFETAAVSSPT